MTLPIHSEEHESKKTNAGFGDPTPAMRFELPPLPFEPDSLAPHISPRTLSFHYEKHHKGYLDKVHDAVEGTPQAKMTIEEIIRTAEGALFNSAAQVWNHSFYWHSLSPDGGGQPDGPIREALESAFGSVDAFRRAFAEAAVGEFGSGWAWLVLDNEERMRVISSSDAENPLQKGETPLLTLDVWEHAYYLDYQNERNRYVEHFLDHLINWDFLRANLEKARGVEIPADASA